MLWNKGKHFYFIPNENLIKQQITANNFFVALNENKFNKEKYTFSDFFLKVLSLCIYFCIK